MTFRLSPLHLLFYALLGVLAINITGCDDDDDPEPENEEELITDVIFTLTPRTDSTETVVFRFEDRDGDGGNDPIQSVTGQLQAGMTYDGTLALTAVEADGGVEDITAEVRDEDDEHQVFYIATDGLDMAFEYDDMDGDGNPLGLLINATAGAAGSGNLTVILRHEPMKDANGIGISNPDPAGGETDIEVVWNATIQ